MFPYVADFYEDEIEDYEALRECLGEEYRDASVEELDALLEEILDGLTPEQVESFWKAVKSFGKKALKFGKKALPGVISGATTGATVGGPWGALIGGLAGGALSAARGAKRPPAPRRAPSPMPRRAATGQPAAAQLLQLLQSPQMLQALLSGVAGGAGRSSIPLTSGGALKSVPRGGLLNLLGSLVKKAAVEAAEINAYESIPSYLLREDGEALGDIANPEERARILWEQLQGDELFLEGTDFLEGYDYGEGTDFLEGDDYSVAEWFVEAGLVEAFNPYEAELEWDD